MGRFSPQDRLNAGLLVGGAAGGRKEHTTERVRARLEKRRSVDSGRRCIGAPMGVDGQNEVWSKKIRTI